MAIAQDAHPINPVHRAILAALKVLYPGGLHADALLRSLLVLFPDLKFDRVRRDLAYLAEKGYVRGEIADAEGGDAVDACRSRLTACGLEVAAGVGVARSRRID